MDLETKFREEFQIIHNKSHLKSTSVTQKITKNKYKNFKFIHKCLKSEQIWWIYYYEFKIPSQILHPNASLLNLHFEEIFLYHFVRRFSF